MRILLVDDHDLFREGLKWLLSSLDDDLHFVEADSLKAFTEMVSQGHSTFDIVLLDVYLPDSDGLDGLSRVRELLPSVTVVVLSSRNDPQFIGTAINNGAAGFIPKSSTRGVLIAALRVVLAGGVYVPPNVLSVEPAKIGQHQESASEARHGQEKDTTFEFLTPRQSDVLKLAVAGKVNKIIARELNISEATVKVHLSASFRALGVKNRTEATYKVAELGWFSQR